jgi:hypothetical protein
MFRCLTLIGTAAGLPKSSHRGKRLFVGPKPQVHRPVFVKRTIAIERFGNLVGKLFAVRSDFINGITCQYNTVCLSSGSKPARCREWISIYLGKVVVSIVEFT